MKIAVLKERTPNETRVAATPDTVKQLTSLGATVFIECGAGEPSAITDEEYRDAGAKVSKEAMQFLAQADIVLKVQPPLSKGDIDELTPIKNGAILIGMLDPYNNKETVEKYAEREITSFSMEFMPRITRAQNMDVLSSQSNLAGYRAVIDAVHEFGKATPMMMTAAGTVPPAKVFILGAGVAGLQAIATARRLGAIVSATDVRPVAKEQVESLGAKFVTVAAEETENAETKGGYAKEMSADYLKRQQELVHETLKKQDIAICTALIPGKPAPVLITEQMVQDMKPGSIIVDLAVGAGGNCPLSKKGKIVVKNGVKIIGYDNVPSRIPVDASRLYSKNLLNFLTSLIDQDNQKLAVNFDDEIVQATLLTKEGSVVHPALTGGN